MKYPKIKSLTFTELEAKVKADEGSDRTDTSATTKANRLLHERYSAELAQRKADHGRKMGEAMKQVGLGRKPPGRP